MILIFKVFRKDETLLALFPIYQTSKHTCTHIPNSLIAPPLLARTHATHARTNLARTKFYDIIDDSNKKQTRSVKIWVAVCEDVSMTFRLTIQCSRLLDTSFASFVQKEARTI